jgi:hypothetical protein
MRGPAPGQGREWGGLARALGGWVASACVLRAGERDPRAARRTSNARRSRPPGAVQGACPAGGGCAFKLVDR